MYRIYMNKVCFPVAPESIDTKIKNKNKTEDLLAGGEVSIPKAPGLTEYKLDLLLPNREYPFAIYPKGFKNAKYYLDCLEKWKQKKSKIKFKVIRELQHGTLDFKTDVKVTIEDYQIKEDVDNGTDIEVSVTLKQYIPYTTKVVKKTKKGKKKAKKKRDTSNKKSTKKKSYTIVSGDTLWAISKKYYGSGSNYTVIYNANKDVIEKAARSHGKSSSSNGHWIYPGTKITIP